MIGFAVVFVISPSPAIDAINLYTEKRSNSSSRAICRSLCDGRDRLYDAVTSIINLVERNISDQHYQTQTAGSTSSKLTINVGQRKRKTWARNLCKVQ